MAFLKQILSCHSLLKITSQWDNPSIDALRAPPCPREDIQSFQLELKAWALLVAPASPLLSLLITLHARHTPATLLLFHVSDTPRSLVPSFLLTLLFSMPIPIFSTWGLSA